MKKTLCCSVRVETLYEISDKAVKVRCFDGSEDILPKSAIFGRDYDVIKSDAYWIAGWILEKKSIQWSNKKSAWFNEKGEKLPSYTIKKHAPAKVAEVESNEIKELAR